MIRLSNGINLNFISNYKKFRDHKNKHNSIGKQEKNNRADRKRKKIVIQSCEYRLPVLSHVHFRF